MLSQADLITLSTVFGKTAEEISGALKSEDEVSLDLRLPGKVYTAEEIEAKTKANQDAYIEIGFKKIAKAAGLDLEPGEKNAEAIVSKLKTGIETEVGKKYKNMTPTKELTEAIQRATDFENKYKVTKETIEDLNAKLEEANGKFTGLQKDISVKERNNSILSSFPEKMGMDRKDALTIINSMLEYEQTEDGVLIKRDGKPILSSTGENESLENVVASLIEEKGWAKGAGAGQGDRGNGSGLPSGLSNDDAMEYIISKGIEPMSAEGAKMMMELTKE